jgi:succinate dehydrogenase / fumarate reductase, flavoprotein subunit
MVDEGRGVGPGGVGVYLDFRDAIQRLGRDVIAERYGNLFDMYANITGEDPYRVPMRIYPAPHYTMGGLWVDYNLMSTIPGLHVTGEANFSDHGANRLGASALMQGLADGYFIVPLTISDYLARNTLEKLDAIARRVPRSGARGQDARTKQLLAIEGRRSVNDFHRELGAHVGHCGMARSESGPAAGAAADSRSCARSSGERARAGQRETFNQSLELAGRVADFIEFAELMCHDALDRDESCGGHFRVEHQTDDGEAKRTTRRVRARFRVGVHRRRQCAEEAPRGTRLRERRAGAAELQVVMGRPP